MHSYLLTQCRAEPIILQEVPAQVDAEHPAYEQNVECWDLSVQYGVFRLNQAGSPSPP